MRQSRDPRAIADALRAPRPLADALAAGAAALREVLAARGAAIAVRRDGRTVRGEDGVLEGALDERMIREADLDATISVSGGIAITDEVALVVALALAARFLAESAQTDGLTGVANRRTFDERLREEWQRAARESTTLAVAIFDIDFFKAYNDRRGHLAGDDALRRVAHAASATLHRGGDRFARYGGEEFAAILPATTLAGAIGAAERIRGAVAALGIAHPIGHAGRLTVSVGVAAAEPHGGGTADDLLASADRELYRAKDEGRDRVCAEGYTSARLPADVLPRPLSVLIGRDEDVAAVNRAIDAHRVVTIAGSAGVGKTRLALAVAHEASERFAHVRFVDAVGAANRDEILARVRAALGVGAGDDALNAITTASTPSTLVVLDGCERIAGACREVLDQLATTPLHFLTTSRVSLGANDEFVVRLKPLDPRATRELFVDRAAAAGVTHDPDDPDIAALLRRLGGSPFGVEIAVARLTETSAAALLREFGDTGPNGPSERATLSSLLRNAVATLDADEAATLVGVATFQGSFTAADAAAVIPATPIDARRANELLREITGRSLLDAASHDGVTRWRMIDPVRDVVNALHSGSELRRSVAASHLKWCLDRLNTIAAQTGTGTNRSALLQSETVIDEVRVALDRALRDNSRIEAGAELCIAAVRQWFAVRQQSEGRERIEAFLDRGDRISPLTRARLHAAAARLAFLGGDLAGMEHHARAADALLSDHDVLDRSPVLNFLGIGAKFRGDLEEAERIFLTGRELNARLGNVRGVAIAIGALGSLAFDVRLDHAEAAERFSEAAAMFRAVGDDLNALAMISNLGEALAAGGALDRAAAVVTPAIEEVRAFGGTENLGHLLCTSALVHELRHDLLGAARALHEAVGLFHTSHGPFLVLVVDYTARVAQRSGDNALAAILLGAAESNSSSRGTPLLPIQRFWREPIIRRVREHLGDAGAETLLARGRATSEAAVIAMIERFLDGLLARESA